MMHPRLQRWTRTDWSAGFEAQSLLTARFGSDFHWRVEANLDVARRRYAEERRRREVMDLARLMASSWGAETGRDPAACRQRNRRQAAEASTCETAGGARSERMMGRLKGAKRQAAPGGAARCQRPHAAAAQGGGSHPEVTPGIGRKRPRSPLSPWRPLFPRSSTLCARCVGERGPERHRRRCLSSRCALPWPASHRPAGGFVA